LSDTEAMPTWPRARTRLFLSADIAGSTAYKQRKTDSGSPTKQWAQAILSFYRDFGQDFFEKLKLAEQQAERQFSKYKKCNPPLFWKAVGDEILFCVELASERQAYVAIVAWINAARKYKETLRKDRLDLKVSAWLATFPTPNFEVVLPRSLVESNHVVSNEGDPLVANWDAIRNYHLNEQEAQKIYSLDFIGPAIDTGFRIAQQSTTRKMAITPELARVIALIHDSFDSDSIDANYKLALRYEGRVNLKGVGDPSGYPVFWIDIASADDKFIQLEDALDASGKKPTGKEVKAFLEEYLRQHAPFKPHLYLPDAENTEFSVLSKELERELIDAQKSYRLEKGRLASEMNQDDVARNETIKQEVTEDIIDKLVEPSSRPS
jgi:hypothetical protein